MQRKHPLYVPGRIKMGFLIYFLDSIKEELLKRSVQYSTAVEILSLEEAILSCQAFGEELHGWILKPVWLAGVICKKISEVHMTSWWTLKGETSKLNRTLKTTANILELV